MKPRGPLLIPVLPEPPRVTFSVPGSKSITNRALVLAALAPGTSRLAGVLHSDDTRHMRAALEQFGVAIADDGAAGLRVDGGRHRLRAPPQPVFVGNSGTTVRFLAALSCLVEGEVTLVGDSAMARRPIEDLVDGLRQLGVEVTCATGCPPLTIRGGGLLGGRVRMRGDRSSQYFSALMMAATFADRDVTIEVEGELVSRPYVDITARMIGDFGGSVDMPSPAGDSGGASPSPPPRFTVRGGGSYVARAYQVEPDASSASYPFALAAASAGRITVPGLGAGALQGDYRFVDVLEEMGARVSRGAHETTVEGTGALRGVDVDMLHISDTVMTLAAIAPTCAGPTTIRNVGNIRIKETDRLLATVNELRRLGQAVQHGTDWLRIDPTLSARSVGSGDGTLAGDEASTSALLRPGVVHCYDDHRIAMSFAILGALRAGVTIEDPACVSKTYPGFWGDLATCYPGGAGRPDWG